MINLDFTFDHPSKDAFQVIWGGSSLVKPQGIEFFNPFIRVTDRW